MVGPATHPKIMGEVIDMDVNHWLVVLIKRFEILVYVNVCGDIPSLGTCYTLHPVLLGYFTGGTHGIIIILWGKITEQSSCFGF